MKSAHFVPLLVLLVPSMAGATDVVFDFTGDQIDQVGSYATSSGAVVGGGVGTLQPGSGWIDPTQHARIAVIVNNPGTAIADQPVRLDLGPAGAAFLHYARNDGEDLQVTTTSGTPVTSWVESADTPELRAALWIRMPMLPAGPTMLEIYAGNATLPTSTDGVAIFTFSAPLAWLVAADTVAPTATLDVQSLTDGNAFLAATTSSTLATTAPFTVAAGMLTTATIVSTAAPATALFGTDGDAPVPLAFAGTTFIEPAPRCVDAFTLYAPGAASTVTILDGATVVATQTVSAGASANVMADIANMHAIVVHATAPVTVHHDAAACDVYDFPPPSTDLFGANGGNGVVAAAVTAHVTAYYSDGTSAAITVPGGTAVALACSGVQGSGCSVHLVSDQPIGAISYGDGDGGDAEAFLDRSALGRVFGVPRAGRYIHVAASEPDTTCVLLAADGTMMSSATGGSVAPLYPDNLYFGGMDMMTHIPAGASLHCNQPVWAVFKDSADAMEKNLWPVQLHRAQNANPPTATFGAIDTRYGSGDQWIATPEYVPPGPAVAWLGFDDTNVSVPNGAALGYQLSTDLGVTWQYVSGGHWMPATMPTIAQSSNGGDVDSAIALLPTTSIAVRAILESTDGVDAPTLDSLRVGVELAPTLAWITLAPIASPQQAVTTFGIHATAIDTTGATDANVNASPTIESDAGPVTVIGTARFAMGVLDAVISIVGQSPTAHVLVTTGGQMGVSNPFALNAGSAATLQSVSGNGQFGAVSTQLASPVVVRTVTSGGAPVPGVPVSFATTSGGGSVSPSMVYSDANGMAGAAVTLGPTPGGNTITVTAQGATATVQFIARADAPGSGVDGGTTPGGGSSSGCGCAVPGGRAPRGALGLAFVAIALVRRRRAKTH